jgi:peptidylprolyl isomerase
MAFLLCTSAVWGQLGSAPVVARIGEVALSTDTVESLIRAQAPEFRQQILDSPEALNALIKAETLRNAVLKEALAVGTDRQAAVVLQAARARDQVIVDQFLNQRSEVPAGYPAEKEIEAAYESNKEQFKIPAMIRMAQLLVRGPMEMPREQRLKQLARASEAHRRLLKGDDFTAIVRSYSEDEDTRNRGGELGWVAEKDIFPLLRMEIDSLPAGAISKPVRTQFGWQIVKIMERRAAGAITLTEARSSLVASMRKTQKESLQAQYLKAIETLKPYEANAEEVQRLRTKLAQ